MNDTDDNESTIGPPTFSTAHARWYYYENGYHDVRPKLHDYPRPLPPVADTVDF